MKKLKKILRGFAGNNRGAGIVVVLVSMVCVALMGASILFMSYTAIRLKATERQASKDFYSVETAMDEIRAGVQSVASEAIASAYKYALENYSTGLDVTSRFQAKFITDLKDSDLFRGDTSTGERVAMLQSFVSNSSAQVSGSCGVYYDDDKPNELVLEDITVTYTANGYTTTINTDIFINAPKFSYLTSSTRISGLPEHALIARKELKQTDNLKSEIVIFGSAYAGKMTLGGTSNSKLTISNVSLVCAGDANISGKTAGGRLVTQPASDGSPFKFWAGRIVVNHDSSVNLTGETRVLNDLELAGSKAKAVLSGSYYGFGDGTVPPENANDRDPSNDNPADYSSAILVNGAKSTLDVSGLRRLMLAGRAFINNTLYPGAETEGTGYTPQNLETLESVSVRTNQQMYLIDPKYLSGISENPVIATSAEANLTTEGLALAETYDFELKHLQLPATGVNTGQMVHYFLMDFDDDVKVSAYFEDYFRENSAQINSYLDAGSNLNSLTISAPGYAINGKNGDYSVIRADDADFGWDSLRATFDLLKTTLIDPNPDIDINNPDDDKYPYDPYDYIVNDDMVNAVDGISEFMLDIDRDGELEVVAVVTDGDFTISSDDDYDDLLMVISSGNVTVNRNFTGLVISGGTIEIKGNVTLRSDPYFVPSAFTAKNAEGKSVSEYLLHGTDAVMGEDVQMNTDGWNMNSIVSYKNWIKN